MGNLNYNHAPVPAPAYRADRTMDKGYLCSHGEGLSSRIVPVRD